jgi:hypothetical protein
VGVEVLFGAVGGLDVAGRVEGADFSTGAGGSVERDFEGDFEGDVEGDVDGDRDSAGSGAFEWPPPNRLVPLPARSWTILFMGRPAASSMPVTMPATTRNRPTTP